MNPYLLHDLAQERQHDAHRFAATARLAAIARCCKPSELSRILGALRGALPGRPACC